MRRRRFTEDETIRRLLTIAGISVLSATALVAAAGDGTSRAIYAMTRSPLMV